MKLLIICLVLMVVMTEVRSFSGGLMCLGKAMCSNKRKNSGRKKNVPWGSHGLWKGGSEPDDGVINWRSWYNRLKRRNYSGFFKTR
jgi:hypothetical protein